MLFYMVYNVTGHLMSGTTETFCSKVYCDVLKTAYLYGYASNTL